MIILYHFLWTLPLVFLVTAAFISGSRRLNARLALRLPKRLPKQGNLWVHALSVGEVISAIPLVARLKKAFPEKDIVFSVTTRSGMAVATEKLSGQVACIMTFPLDAWWCVRRMVHYVSPSVFILVETDLWPALLVFLKQKGVRSLLVNGRISPPYPEILPKGAGGGEMHVRALGALSHAIEPGSGSVTPGGGGWKKGDNRRKYQI